MSSSKRNCLIFICSATFCFVIIGMLTKEKANEVIFNPIKLSFCKYNEDGMKRDLWEKFSNEYIDLMKDLEAAKQSKTKTQFLLAINNLEIKFGDLSNKFDIAKRNDMPTEVPKPSKVQNVCPEKYINSTFGYPRYHKGWEILKCKKKPFPEVLSIVLNFVPMDSKFMSGSVYKLLKNIASGHPGLSVYLASKSALPKMKTRTINLKIKSFTRAPTETDGSVLNFLISNVNTPYVFVGNRIDHFLAEDARLERLVREIDNLKVSIAGGASRNSAGHWNMNCQQATMRNYSLLLRAGYDVSAHECVFCDVIAGPFVATTDFMKKNQFNRNFSYDMTIYEYFLKQLNGKRSSVVCPDAMFYTRQHLSSGDRNTWMPIANEFELYSIKTADNKRLTFSCKEVSTNCHKVKSMAISPCCLRELIELIKLVMSTCEKNGIICELCEGSLLSVIKMNTVFPWEVDADVLFLSRNFSKLASLKSFFRSRGYLLSVMLKTELKNGQIAGGFIKVDSKNWFIELYGHESIDSASLHKEGLSPTRVYFDGQWMQTARNPGLNGRNRYGHEVYRHAEHWRRLGVKSGFTLYNPRGFLKCENPGSHACLDQYNGDGNLQFGDVTL